MLSRKCHSFFLHSSGKSRREREGSEASEGSKQVGKLEVTGGGVGVEAEGKG